MKLLKNFYNKLKNRFKTKSKSKLITLFLFALPFLPIFPYVRNSESIFLFGFIEGSVDNFYETGVLGEIFKTGFLSSDNPSKYDQGTSFYDLALLSEKPIPSPSKQEIYLIEKGLDKELAKCIATRDFFYVNYFYDVEFKRELIKYPPSPVPVIWFSRSIVRWVLDSVTLPEIDFENYQKLNDKCSKYRNILPPKNYLEGDFSF